MRKVLLIVSLGITATAFSQERYIGWTRDSIKAFHTKNFENVVVNDTAQVVKIRRDGTTWRYFRFDSKGICVLTGWEVAFYNDFTDLEKKLKAKKYKNVGEVEYDFVASKVKGALYTNGKENYILMYKPINPNLSATTRAVVYYKSR